MEGHLPTITINMNGENLTIMRIADLTGLPVTDVFPENNQTTASATNICICHKRFG
jgi:hypothetical protein